jgi:hypothetical protein
MGVITMITTPEYVAVVCKDLLDLKMYDSADEVLMCAKYGLNRNNIYDIFGNGKDSTDLMISRATQKLHYDEVSQKWVCTQIITDDEFDALYYQVVGVIKESNGMELEKISKRISCDKQLVQSILYLLQYNCIINYCPDKNTNIVYWKTVNWSNIMTIEDIENAVEDASDEWLGYEVIRYTTAMFFAEDSDGVLEAMTIARNMRLY